MTITPDNKDWTWVLERPCDECGFVAADHDAREVAPLILHAASAWAVVLRRPDVARRPVETVWSPLEYGCHVRDVLRIFAVRIALIRDEDNPTFANWDQDETALDDRYEIQDPATVRAELLNAAERLGVTLSTVGDDEWAREGVRSNGSRFTLASLSLSMLHDVHHHLWDVGGA
jgi:hypothetical protein